MSKNSAKLWNTLGWLEAGVVARQRWLHDNWAVATLLLMLLALAMRMAQIATESIYLDEAFSIWYGQQRLGYLLEGVAHDTNPPLHFIVLKYWMELFGKDETAVRLLSTFLSVITIPVIMAIGRRFFDHGTAFAAALIFAASEIHVYYSHEARTYTLVVLLAAFSLYFFLSLLENASWRSVLGLALSNALLLHSHYAIYGFFLMQGLAVLLFSFGRKKVLVRYCLSQLMALVLFLPWALFFLSRFQMMSHMPDLVDGKMLHFVLLRFAGSETMKWGFLGLLALGLPLAIFLEIRKRKTATPTSLAWPKLLGILALLGFCGMMVNYLVSSLWLPTFQVNYVLWATLGIYFLLAWIWARLPMPATVRWLLGIAVTWYMVSTVKYDYWRISDWRSAVAQVKFLDGESTLKLIGLNYLDLPMMYYYDMEAFKDYRRTQQKMNAQQVFGLGRMEDLQRANPAKFSRVLLIDGEGRIQREDYPWIQPLEEVFGPATAVYQFRSIQIMRFEKAQSDSIGTETAE